MKGKFEVDQPTLWVGSNIPYVTAEIMVFQRI